MVSSELKLSTAITVILPLIMLCQLLASYLSERFPKVGGFILGLKNIYIKMFLGGALNVHLGGSGCPFFDVNKGLSCRVPTLHESDDMGALFFGPFLL